MVLGDYDPEIQGRQWSAEEYRAYIRERSIKARQPDLKTWLKTLDSFSYQDFE